MTIRMNFDRVTRYYINSVPYFFEEADDQYAFFRRDDGSAAVERFTWPTLHEIVQQPEWDYEKLSKSVDEAKSQPDLYACLQTLSKANQTLVSNRWCFFCGIDRRYMEGGLILKPRSVAEHYPQIKAYAAEEWKAFHEIYGSKYFSSTSNGFGFDASPTSILRWYRAVKKSGGRMDALIDRRGKASKLDIDQDSYLFIQQHLREYLLNQRHTGREVVENTIRAVRCENERRGAAGLPLLQTRGKTALWEWLRRFDRLEVDAGREGSAIAKRRYLGVGKTDLPSRPGQGFLVDEWEIDARTIILNGPMREGLDQKTIDKLPRGRRWLYVVIDVATRYIVGLVVASSQNSASAIRALEMATRDKADLAAAAETQSSWKGFPFESVASDTGSAFRAGPTTRAVTESHATYSYPNVGEPQLRGTIERVFRTFTHRAMPYIPGRTFSNPKERGDYQTEEAAVLTDDQLALIFIRYVVDVYHNTLHLGLFQETPAAALERLSGTVGIPPQLPRSMRRRAFGICLERQVTAKGISVTGIAYNSRALQVLRRRPQNTKVTLYLDPNDLGTISVWTGKEWLEVECSVENFHGVKLDEWVAVGRILRRRYAGQAALAADTIWDALQAMRSRANEAMRIMGVLPQQTTAEDVERLEKELYLGLSVIENEGPDLEGLERSTDGIGYIIGDPDVGQSDAPSVEALSPSTDVPDDDGDPDEDTTWWQEGGDL
ncbi:Mu transposase C-terminal domain-containing protein [Celeribacter sp. ULVN23_4]